MSTRRLFFALWLDEPAARAVHHAAQQLVVRLGGRAMRPETLHFTLAFLGDVAADKIEALQRLGESLAAGTAPFCLTFDQIGHWPHNRIVWASCSQRPAPLTDLVLALRANIAALGMRVDERPFFPHVSLLRNVRQAAALDAALAVDLSVRELRLMQSVATDPGVRYDTFMQWALRGGTPSAIVNAPSAELPASDDGKLRRLQEK